MLHKVANGWGHWEYWNINMNIMTIASLYTHHFRTQQHTKAQKNINFGENMKINQPGVKD